MNFTNISNFSQPLESYEMTSTLAVYLTEGETTGLVVFLVFFGLTGFLQNLVLILSISLTDGFADTPANLFILSLACADLLLCAVSAPLLIYNIYYSIFNIYTTVSIFVVAATTGSIFLLTLNRFVSTVRPLKYPKIMTFERSVAMIGVVWFLATLASVVALATLFIEKKTFPIIPYVVVFYITSSIVMYVYMYNLGRKHSKHIAQQMHAITGQTQATIDEFRALTSLFMIAGCFAACWLPLAIASSFINRFEDPAQFYRTFCFTSPLSLVNAVVDTIVYYYRVNGFRLSLKKLVIKAI